MKIVVMSDSHSYDDRVRDVISANRNADAFLHCGDLESDPRYFPEVNFVTVNNDWGAEFPKEAVFNFNGVGIYMNHSDRLYPDRVKVLVQKAKQNNCQIAIYGHTHRIDDRIVDGIRVLNPGSLFYNRDMSELGYFVIDIDPDGNYTVSRKKVSR
ncbi:MAG: YfcE family phosphodiesterase [Erysipelotrichaceae bacterium]|nr:YfcE family phosphodiesterase [Erysipelotrichaceae bacterium]